MTRLSQLIEGVASAGMPNKGGFENTLKSMLAYCITYTFITAPVP